MAVWGRGAIETNLGERPSVTAAAAPSCREQGGKGAPLRPIAAMAEAGALQRGAGRAGGGKGDSAVASIWYSQASNSATARYKAGGIWASRSTCISRPTSAGELWT